MKKYKLTKETIKCGGKTLYRIKAVRSFGDVTKGDTGGYVESETNLSHDGDCWVYGSARVYGNAVVYDNARVYGSAEVYGNAVVYDNAEVYGSAVVCDNARVYGSARVYGNAVVYDNARVYGSARVSGSAKVCGSAECTQTTLSLYEPNLYEYTITFTDYHVQIGCQQMLASEWLEVGLDDAVNMGLHAKFYKNLKELLEVLIPQYYNQEIQ